MSGCVIIVAALRIHLHAGPLKAVAPGAALGVCPMLRPRFYLRHAAALEKHYLYVTAPLVIGIVVTICFFVLPNPHPGRAGGGRLDNQPQAIIAKTSELG